MTSFLSHEAVTKVWAAGGKLSLAQLLRCRVRYFSHGMAVGREGFVELVFSPMREAFTSERKTGARKMVGGDWDGLCAARALRVKPVDPGGG